MKAHGTGTISAASACWRASGGSTDSDSGPGWIIGAAEGRELSNLELRRGSAQEAGNAIALRDDLAATNVDIGELNKLRRQYPNPQAEILRLTELLPDSAYITQYTQDGRKIRVRGRGTEAAALQQSLTEQRAFKSVTAPQAISRVGTTGLEQFFLDIELKPRS